MYFFFVKIIKQFLFVSDKNITNQSQKSFPLLQQNISELNLEESKPQCLITAGEHLKQHLNINYGFSNLDEYNSHILPPRITPKTNDQITIPKGNQSKYFCFC